MRRSAVIAGLVLLLVALSAFSTRDASGGSHQFWYSASGTGAVIGQGAAMQKGRQFVSIGTMATSVTNAVVRIKSTSLFTGGPAWDTLGVAGSWSGYFRNGVDSLEVITNVGGMSITVND